MDLVVLAVVSRDVEFQGPHLRPGLTQVLLIGLVRCGLQNLAIFGGLSRT